MKGSERGSDPNEIVYSDPFGSLPFRSTKYSSNCEELHLGGRGIQALRDFESFVALSVLWLNDNQLENLEGLEENFRIKELYAHSNKIKRLQEEGLAHCTFLSRLTLNDNKLDDLENIITELKPMNHLKNLDLFGNPIAQEDNYRLRMIGELSTLRMLDRHEITAEERAAAKAFLKKMKKMNNFSLSKRTVVVPAFTAEEEKLRQEALDVVLQRLRLHTYNNRIPLEESFWVWDKRRQYRLPAEKFWDVLKALNLSREDIMDEYEMSLVTDKYSCRISQSAISMTGALVKELIHYRKFCEDVVRHELRQYPNEVYRPDIAPAISHSTMDLMKFVKNVERKTLRVAEETRRQELAASAQATQGEGTVFAGHGAAQSKAVERGLDNWSAGELSKIIKHHNTESFTFDQAEGVMRKMMNFGYVPVLGLRGAREALADCGSGKDTLSVVELKDALGISLVETTDMPVIKWRQLQPLERDKLATRVFSDSANLLDNLLRCGAADDTTELVQKTAMTAIHGTRLESTKQRLPEQEKFVTPSMALNRAPRRADVTIIPNLLPDVMREEKEKEILDGADWSKKFAKLGLKGEFLQVALERKRRSTLKADARTKQREADILMQRQHALAKAMNRQKGGGKEDKEDKDEGAKKRKALVPFDDGGPKGWASSTGYCTIDGKERNKIPSKRGGNE